MIGVVDNKANVFYNWEKKYFKKMLNFLFFNFFWHDTKFFFNNISQKRLHDFFKIHTN